MKNKNLYNICARKSITLTPLRQEILNIIYGEKSPLGAYEILKKLKVKRPNAQPPTVYRVLEFFMEEKLIHRVESQNTYVACSHIDESEPFHLAVLLFCKKCHNSAELEDKNVLKRLKNLADNHSFDMSSSVIEIQGTCKKCLGSKALKK